ncbi:hypothetical protein CK203_016863 [Vitis vinifera]|uniref:Uncharacterized protein n=1 Tax=Vitis vinifera TaxID=29760 RepID=A0A438JNF3_VITVI|nr:hypothetical protein CK203_016863 [Vitis vinifera]
MPPSTFVKEITIRELEVPPLPSVSSGSGRLAGLNHSGPSLLVAGRLALLAEEATSINQPGSPHPDADAAGPLVLQYCLIRHPQQKKWGQKVRFASLRAKPPCLCTGEGVCYMEDDHPEGSEVEMAEENPAAPALVPDGGGNPVDDAACISASSFSYAELEEKLKRILLGSDVAMPSAKMFEAVEMLVSGLRGMAQQHDLFSDLLQTDDYMKAFASQRRNSEEELRLRLEQAEASLSAAREDYEALRVELAEAKSQEELVDARLHETEDEMALLRGRRGNSGRREELEADYQKQVDEMYFFGYRCCMKKHGIKRDVPSIPPGKEEKPAQ